MTLPEGNGAGIGAIMRFLPLLALLLSGCSSTKSGDALKNSRVKEQERLNAAVAEERGAPEDKVLRWDENKTFNPSTARFGGGGTFATGKAQTNEFYFVDKTQTKSFRTGGFATREAESAKVSYATREAPTKESRFSGQTAPTRSFATAEDRQANKEMATRSLPGGDRTFAAQGRRQAALDKTGSKDHPMGGDRSSGESWSGDLKPLTIQDVRTLLNKN